MNWKTSLWGVVGIVAVVSGAVWSFHTTGHVPDLSALLAQISVIATGVGLLAAKDNDVTGGTRHQ